MWCFAVAVACCQTAERCSWGEEVDNCNAAVLWFELLGPALGPPEVHVLISHNV